MKPLPRLLIRDSPIGRLPPAGHFRMWRVQPDEESLCGVVMRSRRVGLVISWVA